MSNEVVNTAPVTATGEIKFEVKLSEQNGRVLMEAKQLSGGPLPMRTQVCLYRNSYPENPNEKVIDWFWLRDATSKVAEGQPWGRGYGIAISIQDDDGKQNSEPPYRYGYVVKSPFTK